MLLGFQLPFFQQLPNPGLALLAVWIVLLAVWWLWVGYHTAALIRSDGETRFSALRRSGGGRVGIGMLATFLGAILFLLLNVGLSLLGL